MSKNRQDVGSEYTLFILLKGVETAFRKPNGFFCLPLQTCGMTGGGGDASQILTWFQEKSNLRVPSVDGKGINMTPPRGSWSSRDVTLCLASAGHREEAALL